MKKRWLVMRLYGVFILLICCFCFEIVYAGGVTENSSGVDDSNYVVPPQSYGNNEYNSYQGKSTNEVIKESANDALNNIISETIKSIGQAFTKGMNPNNAQNNSYSYDDSENQQQQQDTSSSNDRRSKENRW